MIRLSLADIDDLARLQRTILNRSVLIDCSTARNSKGNPTKDETRWPSCVCLKMRHQTDARPERLKSER
jgi:hypothetical protein